MIVFRYEDVRSRLTAGIGFVEVRCIRMVDEGHVTSLVGDSIIVVGVHIFQELFNSGRCVFCVCGLLGTY